MTTFQTIKNLYAAGSKAEAFTAHKADPSGLAVSFDSFCTKMDLILKLKNSEPAVPGKTICYQEMGGSTEAVLQYSCSHRSGSKRQRHQTDWGWIRSQKRQKNLSHD